MINLLSPEMKRELRAARLNVVLRRYVNLLGIGLISLAGIFGAGFYLSLQQKATALKDKQNYESQTSQYTKVREQAEEFTKNLATARQILTNEVVLSTVIVDIAKALPKGSVLTGLSLQTSSLKSPFTLTARVKDYNGALKLKDTLEESAIFNNVSIISITQDKAETTTSVNTITLEYPFMVNMTATLTPTTTSPTTGGN